MFVPKFIQNTKPDVNTVTSRIKKVKKLLCHRHYFICRFRRV